MSQSADGSLSTGLGRCYRHPMRETGVRCVRCDRPICPDCMRPASVGFMCPDDVKLGNATIRQPTTMVGASLPRGETPVVSYGLIALNVLIFGVTTLSSVNGVLHNIRSGQLNNYTLVPQRVADNHEYYRLLTSAFLHISLLHIGANMLALFVFGPPLERLLGRWRFASVYLLAALGGSAAIMVAAPALTPVAGASGAIFGLFAAALVLARQLGIDPRSLVPTIIINVVITFVVPNISVQGHIGGFVVGAAAAAAIGGLPGRPARRVPTAVQAGSLGALLAVVLLVILVRTVTYPGLS